MTPGVVSYGVVVSALRCGLENPILSSSIHFVMDDKCF